MFLNSFLLGFHLFVILIVCSAVESTESKRLQKCQAYSVHVYGQAVPTCKTSADGDSQAITIQEFPHIAILGYRYNNDDGRYGWHCHGSLVSSRYVLSIAHCLQNSRATLSKVRLGAESTNYSGESISSDYDVEKTVLHPLSKSSSFYNHIGLIKLSRKVDFSENVRPICLPDSGDLISNTLYEVNYLSTKENKPEQRPLTKYKHSTLTNDECNEIELYAPGQNRKFIDGITDELLCSRKNISGDYACVGESGTPLYIDHSQISCSHVQLGISSFGTGCYVNNLPGVATRVFNFSDWIESVIWADGEDL